jgi:uncharacterized protein
LSPPSAKIPPEISRPASNRYGVSTQIVHFWKDAGFVERWDVAGTRFGTIAGLWRYPVKSLQGELLSEGQLTPSGLVGDRVFGIFERSTDVLLSAKRLPKMLEGSAVLVPGSELVAELNFDGNSLRSNDPGIHKELSSWLELDVELREPKAGRRSVVETQVDLDDDSQLAEFSTRPGVFFDSCSLNLVSTTSLAAASALYPAGVWGVERFRPNVLIETETAIGESSFDEEERPGFVDDELVGFVVSVGTVEIVVMKRCDRCVMITRPFGAFARDRALLRTLARFHGNELGLDAMVSGSGLVTIGDPITLVRRS